MIAIIRMPTFKQQVSVKDKFIDGTGYVRIVADDGAIYETHLSNVCFVSGVPAQTERRADNGKNKSL